MYRRDFLKQSAALLAVSGLPSYAGQLADMKKRVGLIGSGWYGKSGPPAPRPGRAGRSRRSATSTSRWCRTQPISSRPGNSKKRPRVYSDYRALLKSVTSTW